MQLKNWLQNIVAKWFLPDFHLKAAQHLIAEHFEFSTLMWIKTRLQSTMK